MVWECCRCIGINVQSLYIAPASLWNSEIQSVTVLGLIHDEHLSLSFRVMGTPVVYAVEIKTEDWISRTINQKG